MKRRGPKIASSEWSLRAKRGQATLSVDAILGLLR